MVRSVCDYIQVSSIIGEGGGERGRRGGGRLRRRMGGGERVMMINLRTDCDVPSPQRGTKVGENNLKKLLAMRASIQRKTKTQTGKQHPRSATTDHGTSLKHLQSLIQTFSSV